MAKKGVHKFNMLDCFNITITSFIHHHNSLLVAGSTCMPIWPQPYWCFNIGIQKDSILEKKIKKKQTKNYAFFKGLISTNGLSIPNL